MGSLAPQAKGQPLSPAGSCLGHLQVNTLTADPASLNSPAGSMLGGLTDRGRGTIMRYDVDILYLNVALGLMTMVSTLRTFGEHRVVFFREAATGLNKWVLLIGGFCAAV